MTAKAPVRQSELLCTTYREPLAEEPSINAQMLIRGGFVDRLMAGVFSFLPLGMRVLHRIENIIREEMDAVNSHELLMPALHPTTNWAITGRDESMQDVLYRVDAGQDKHFYLGPSHEEVVTPLVNKALNSYKELPVSVYQIQTKYRKEARPKSGLLRGREFRMKDMYSFHMTDACMDSYYERATTAYMNVFKRCGLGDKTYITYASGGAFSKFSHEFQTVTEHGEDIIYISDKTDKHGRIAINREIYDEIKTQDEWKDCTFEETKAIEVGNIFKLGTKFSESFNMQFDFNGEKVSPLMGCYGIGSSRVLGTVAEVCNDDNGMCWPEAIAPFNVHVISLLKDSNAPELTALLEQLSQSFDDILVDDRDVSAGVKFGDSDLIGIPVQCVISERTLKTQSVELKLRRETGRDTLAITGLNDAILKRCA